MVKMEVLQLTMKIYLKSYTQPSLYCAINIKKTQGKVMGDEWSKQIEWVARSPNIFCLISWMKIVDKCEL